MFESLVLKFSPPFNYHAVVPVDDVSLVNAVDFCFLSLVKHYLIRFVVEQFVLQH